VETTVERFRHQDSVETFSKVVRAAGFLWLVIGYFLQQRELEQNTRVLGMSVQQAEIQSQNMAASEMHARQETFLRLHRTFASNSVRSSVLLSRQAPVPMAW
jgi:hypothetical protein